MHAPVDFERGLRDRIDNPVFCKMKHPEGKIMSEASTKPVSARELLVRINHRLAAKGKVAVLNHSMDDPGDCHIIDISTNHPLEKGLDLEALGAETGVMEDGEFLDRQI